jgi:hypothetical protein
MCAIRHEGEDGKDPKKTRRSEKRIKKKNN